MAKAICVRRPRASPICVDSTGNQARSRILALLSIADPKQLVAGVRHHGCKHKAFVACTQTASAASQREEPCIVPVVLLWRSVVPGSPLLARSAMRIRCAAPARMGHVSMLQISAITCCACKCAEHCCMSYRVCGVGVCAAGVVLHMGCCRSAVRRPGAHGVWHACTCVYLVRSCCA